ncbi:MAG TPA: hemolysin family protein [Aromatoleum sp.]|uniref:hemolysin family protein n=1 Tax=Aromatoleum sp. TaxID=2307007 RepID=UPI002B47187C|nr:hemolysin family protein [Aromatoleum sp.]HJV26235.1 hemolysin family protein [Aromatoleum sp.]
MEIILLVALILVNGVFAMSEIALVTAKRARLARLAEDGDPAAAVAMKLGEEPTRFLSTIQIGITSIGILNGIVGEAALADPLSGWLQQLGLAQRPSEITSTVLAVVAITYISIVVGELVPKRIGQINPEGIARLVARPMNALAIGSRPFVRLLMWSTSMLLTLLGKRDEAAPGVTEEEIHALLEEGSEAGVIEKSEHEMVRNVFRLDERQIASLMVPRADVVWLDIHRPLDENLARMAESQHSRFPVCRGGLDDILGIISSKQLFNQTLKGGKPDLTQQLEPAIYVPESLTGMELLEQFRASSTHMVFVIDEYGEIQGVVTLQDVLEAVTGEFQPHSLEEAWAVQREDGSWLLDGMIPVPELKDRLELKTVPEEEKGRYHTLSGLVMWILGRLPHTGDVATWEDWRLEVVDLDGKRIDKVLASRMPETVQTEPDNPPAPEAEA